MAKKGEYEIPAEIIKYNGVFDLDELYLKLQNWIRDQGYYFEEGSYKVKVPSPAGAEHDIDWNGWRKASSYAKYWVYVRWKIWDLRELEVIKDGKKKKLFKGRLRIIISGKLEIDWQGRFKGNKALQGLWDFYNSFIAKKTIETIYWDELYYRILKLHAVAKETLDMQAKTNAYFDVW